MPATANSTSTDTSPLYSPRSRRNGHAYSSATADTRQVPILRTSAMLSRMNIPPRTVPCPPTPATSNAATTTRLATASRWVTTRCFSLRNRSSISSANAAPTSASSGISGSSSVAEGVARVDCIVVMASSKLGGGELRRQLRDGRLHQVDQGLRPHAQHQHAGREHAQHQPLACVDVLEFGDVGIADLAPDHPLGQPQRVAGADDQGERGEETDQRVVLERGQDD